MDFFKKIFKMGVVQFDIIKGQIVDNMEVVLATIEMEQVTRARQLIFCITDRRSDIYG